jgi:hypothetical protein
LDKNTYSVRRGQGTPQVKATIDGKKVKPGVRKNLGRKQDARIF